MSITAEYFINYLDNTDAIRKNNFKQNKMRYGTKSVRKPVDIWGPVNHTTGLGMNSRFVDCTGHGGAIIPWALNLTIDEELRDNWGFYEEDCDIMILLAYYPKMGRKLNPNFEEFKTEKSTRAYAVDRIMDYNPDKVKKILIEVLK